MATRTCNGKKQNEKRHENKVARFITIRNRKVRVAILQCSRKIGMRMDAANMREEWTYNILKAEAYERERKRKREGKLNTIISINVCDAQSLSLTSYVCHEQMDGK